MERDEVIRQGMEKMNQAQMDALGFAHDEGKSTGDAEGYARGREEAGSPLPEDTTPYDQAYVDQKVAEAVDPLKADFAAREVAFKQTIADLEAKNVSADEASEAIADQFKAMSASFEQAVRDLIQKQAPTPAPVEEEEAEEDESGEEAPVKA